MQDPFIINAFNSLITKFINSSDIRIEIFTGDSQINANPLKTTVTFYLKINFSVDSIISKFKIKFAKFI